MTFYAVIDTNVLVSALLSKNETAATTEILVKIATKEIIPVYSDEIMDEYMDVLHRKKFHFSEDRVDLILAMLEDRGEKLTPAPTGEILPDPKDLPFYEVVMEKGEDDAWLVTGNLKHFPVKPFVVTPREFLDIINGEK